MSEIVVALDYPNSSECLEFLDKLGDELDWVKVGMQLYYAEGPSLIKELKSRNYKVFLDLKLHDIPNTVASAIKSLNELKVDMTNLHCSGTGKMMRAAQESVSKDCFLIGVTQLTSTDEESMKKDIGIASSLKESVAHYASLAKESGLSGVVCSAQEVGLIKEQLGKDFLTICPGIRLQSNNNDDQVRVCTPLEAQKMGADYLVIGRSITKAEEPLKVIRDIKKDLNNE